LVDVDTTATRGGRVAEELGGPTRVTKLDGGPAATAPGVVVGSGLVAGAGLVTGGLGWSTVGVVGSRRPIPIPMPPATSAPVTARAASRW
jgi:hypothetical protein